MNIKIVFNWRFLNRITLPNAKKRILNSEIILNIFVSHVCFKSMPFLFRSTFFLTGHSTIVYQTKASTYLTCGGHLPTRLEEKGWGRSPISLTGKWWGLNVSFLLGEWGGSPIYLVGSSSYPFPKIQNDRQLWKRYLLSYYVPGW